MRGGRRARYVTQFIFFLGGALAFGAYEADLMRSWCLASATIDAGNKFNLTTGVK
jgi:hypothetical protein